MGRQSGAMVLEVVYGIRALPKNDPHIRAAELAMAYGGDGATPGRYLVETIPWLKYVPAWLPGASFQRFAQKANKVIASSVNLPFEEVKRALVSGYFTNHPSRDKTDIENKASGTAIPSFAARCLESIDNKSDVAYQETVIKNTAGSIFGGEIFHPITEMIVLSELTR